MWRTYVYEVGGLPAVVRSVVSVERVDGIVVTYGALGHRLEDIVLELALSREIFLAIVVITAIGTSSLEGILELAHRCGRVAFVEEGSAGGSVAGHWLAQDARSLGSLPRPPTVLTSRDDVIPSGIVNEARTVLQPREIRAELLRMVEDR